MLLFMCLEWMCRNFVLFHLSYSCLFLCCLLVLRHYMVYKDEYIRSMTHLKQNDMYFLAVSCKLPLSFLLYMYFRHWCAVVSLRCLYSEGVLVSGEHSSNQQAWWQAAHRGRLSAYHSTDSQVLPSCTVVQYKLIDWLNNCNNNTI